MIVQETREYLDSFINYEFNLNTLSAWDLKLERIRRLLDLLVPNRNLMKFVHVAGTTGKGSTCQFAAAILQSAGYKVGLYTSPHLTDCTERIRVLDKHSDRQKQDYAFEGKISDEELSALIEAARPAIEEIRSHEDLGSLTFFEVYTALAVYHFCRCGVDCAVLETGLGGRLDATNALDTLVCGISPIDLEHTHILGSTLEQIAREKAAIIKDRRQTVIVGSQCVQVRQVIEERCCEIKAKPYWLNQDIRYRMISSDLNGQVFDVQGIRQEYKDLKISLLGTHQVENAAMAVGLVESLQEHGIAVGPENVRDGLKQAVWPGRFEIVLQKPCVILDGAHNPASLEALVRTVQDIFPKRKVIVVLGLSSDKDKQAICRQIAKIAGRVILTKAQHPRSWDFSRENLSGLFDEKILTKTGNVKEALSIALYDANEDDIVLVTGSLFVVGEARSYVSIK